MNKNLDILVDEPGLSIATMYELSSHVLILSSDTAYFVDPENHEVVSLPINVLETIVTVYEYLRTGDDIGQWNLGTGTFTRDEIVLEDRTKYEFDEKEIEKGARAITFDCLNYDVDIDFYSDGYSEATIFDRSLKSEDGSYPCIYKIEQGGTEAPTVFGEILAMIRRFKAESGGC